jgi:replicative DNA helicase
MSPNELRYSKQAEQGVLASLLNGGSKALQTVQDRLRAEDFYERAHQAIYRAIVALDARGEPIDALTVIEELRGTDPGAILPISDILVTSSGYANLASYTALVCDWAARRRVQDAARRIVDLCGSGAPLAEIHDQAQGLATIGLIADDLKGPVSVSTLVPKWIDALDTRSKAKDKLAGLPTGFSDLDRKTGGLEPGNLIVVAGRPSMGKTALAVTVMSNIWQSRNVPCLMFSLEMSGDEILTRLVAAHAKVPIDRLRSGSIEEQHWPGVHSAMRIFSGAVSMLVDESPSMMLPEIRNRARQTMVKHGTLGLIVVDYLQLMTAHDDADTRAQEIAGITRGLKALAKELKVPVMVLSQLNREVERRQDRRPMLSDLKESSAIEQDADLIMFLYRDVVYNQTTSRPALAEVIIGKQRNGPTGTVLMTYLTEYAMFASIDADSQQEFWNEKREQKRASRKKGYL